MEDKLIQIQKSLDTIKAEIKKVKKGTQWILPIIMLVLSTITGSLSYRFQKNTDANMLDKMKIAEQKAKHLVDFFDQVENRIEKLSLSFDQYTEFGDSASSSKLNTEMGNFYEYYIQLTDIDPTILKKMEEYSQFISETKNNLETKDFSSEWKNTARKRFFKSQEIKQGLEDRIANVKKEFS